MRVTGEVRDVETRTGNKDGRDWSMVVARVLFADLDFIEVTYPDKVAFPKVGDRVDLIVRVSVRGGFLSVQAVKPFPAPVQAVKAS
jgi:hypothetical protein